MIFAQFSMRVVHTPTASDYIICKNLSNKHLVSVTTKRGIAPQVSAEEPTKDTVSFSAKYSTEKVSVINFEYENECESESEQEDVSVIDIESQDVWGPVEKKTETEFIHANECKAQPFSVINFESEDGIIGVQHVPLIGSTASEWAIMF